LNPEPAGTHRRAGAIALAAALALLLSACAPFPGSSVADMGGTAGSRRSGDPWRHDPQKEARLRREVVTQALAELDRPYRWGAENPRRGFDCSGLIQYAYARVGIHVPRTAHRQYADAARLLYSMNELEPGDLVFFRIDDRISHVGMYIGHDRMIHSPSRGEHVRIERLNKRYWRQRFAGAARYIP